MSLDPGDIVDHYEIIQHFASGSFAKIYEVRDINKPKFTLLMKVSKLEVNDSRREYQVLKEYERQFNNSPQLKITLPTAYWYGEDDEYGYLVMPKLGTNLYQAFTSIEWSDQYLIDSFVLLKRLQSIGLVHGDIKLENIVQYQNRWYLIDWSLPSLNTKKSFCGNLMFASVNAHQLNEITNRNDQESMIYLLASIKSKQMPIWSQYIKEHTNAIKQIGDMKKSRATHWIQTIFGQQMREILESLLDQSSGPIANLH